MSGRALLNVGNCVQTIRCHIPEGVNFVILKSSLVIIINRPLNQTQVSINLKDIRKKSLAMKLISKARRKERRKEK
jgi:hypothetical protein